MKVVATIYPIADIAQNLGGNLVKAESFIEPGMSPHNYEAKPSDVEKLVNADIILVVGAGLDQWIVDLARGAGVDESKIVDLSSGVELITNEEGGQGDPHYWMSPKRVLNIIDPIKNKLVENDPSHQEDYIRFYDDFTEELDNLILDMADKIGTFRSKDIVTFHEAFSYLAVDFGINIVGVIEPTIGLEPTPQELEDIIKKVDEYQVRAVFIEPQLSSDIVEALKDDPNVQIGVLDPLGGIEGRNTYIGLMKYNLLELSRLLS